MRHIHRPLGLFVFHRTCFKNLVRPEGMHGIQRRYLTILSNACRRTNPASDSENLIVNEIMLSCNILTFRCCASVASRRGLINVVAAIESVDLLPPKESQPSLRQLTGTTLIYCRRGIRILARVYQAVILQTGLLCACYVCSDHPIADTGRSTG